MPSWIQERISTQRYNNHLSYNPDGHKNLPFLPEELMGASGPTIKKFEILKSYYTSNYNCTISSEYMEPRYITKGKVLEKY